MKTAKVLRTGAMNPTHGELLAEESEEKEVLADESHSNECPVCKSPLEDSGSCSDVGDNGCDYLKENNNE